MSTDTLSLSLRGFGTARADLSAVAALRKSLPAWAPADTPGHFLKHADEQTVLAVAAVDQTIRSAGLPADYFRNWIIVAAPRFIGRIAGVSTLERFGRGGGPAISPHLIPQHSLHSISGALSILLATRRPNFGIGGTGNTLTEGLLAALTFPQAGCDGVLLVSTAWDPEPQLDAAGECTNQPIGHAVALALNSATSHQDCGHLQCHKAGAAPAWHVANVAAIVGAAEFCRTLAGLVPGGRSAHFAWHLPGGGSLSLEAHAMLAGLSAAA